MDIKDEALLHAVTLCRNRGIEDDNIINVVRDAYLVGCEVEHERAQKSEAKLVYFFIAIIVISGIIELLIKIIVTSTP